MLRNRAKLQLKDYSSGAKVGICMLKANFSLLHSLPLILIWLWFFFSLFLFFSFSIYCWIDIQIIERKSSLILPRKLFISSCFFNFQVGSQTSFTLQDLNVRYFWWLTKVQRSVTALPECLNHPGVSLLTGNSSSFPHMKMRFRNI